MTMIGTQAIWEPTALHLETSRLAHLVRLLQATTIDELRCRSIEHPECLRRPHPARQLAERCELR